jgi:predicted alpha/beta-fold hydrolase
MSAGPLSLRPPPGLAGRHLQTIATSLPLRPRAWRQAVEALKAGSTEVLLTVGDGVRLMGRHCPGTDPRRGLVVLLHGWEGSSEASYMLSLAVGLHKAGFATFRLNLRDHGGTFALNRELFHSCRIGEVVGAVRAIHDRFSPCRTMLVGYSLGGNFALRVGARQRADGLEIDRIVAICPVLHPPHTMAALESGFWAYRRYYLRRWRRSLLAKQACFPQHYALGDLKRFKTLTETTDFFVREYTEFRDLESYLEGYSIVGSALRDLAAPSRIIAAADDPIIPRDDLHRLASNPLLATTVVPWGGHCGFVVDYRLTSGIDAMVVDELLAEPTRESPPAN